MGQLLLELHLTPRYGLADGERLVSTIQLIRGAGFELHRASANLGARRDWFQTLSAVNDAGWGLPARQRRQMKACATATSR